MSGSPKFIYATRTTLDRQLNALGARSINFLVYVASVAGTLAGLARASAAPGNWSRPIRSECMRQIYVIAGSSMVFAIVLALALGTSFIFQLQSWLRFAGQSELFGPAIALIWVHVLAPFIVAITLVGKSGSALVGEIGLMRLSGEVHALDIRGIDPFLYVVMPRMIAFVTSTFLLTLIFVTVSTLAGFSMILATGLTSAPLSELYTDVALGLSAADLMTILIKTLAAPLFAGAIVCYEGFSVGVSANQFQGSINRGVGRALVVVSLVHALGTGALVWQQT